MAAGRNAARESAARVLCQESPARVRELESLGVTFDADRHGNLALGLEGGHSVRRIVHAGGSATGRRITRELSARAATDDRIHVLEPAAAVALWTLEGRCIGLLARRRDGAALPVVTRATVLATGGMAALWERTTNPPGAVGAGLGLAEAAGARLADLEFMQFHPTALRMAGAARRASSSPRRCAARAPPCSGPTASGSWTSWRPATRWRWPSRPSSPAAGSAR